MRCAISTLLITITERVSLQYMTEHICRTVHESADSRFMLYRRCFDALLTVSCYYLYLRCFDALLLAGKVAETRQLSWLQ
jgi:hypothetical protein